MNKKYALSKQYDIYPIIEIIDDMIYVNDRGMKGFLYENEIRAYSNWKFILYLRIIFKK